MNLRAVLHSRIALVLGIAVSVVVPALISDESPVLAELLARRLADT
jgi:hypothetical protein